jgi:hypothetical protein
MAPLMEGGTMLCGINRQQMGSSLQLMDEK